MLNPKPIILLVLLSGATIPAASALSLARAESTAHGNLIASLDGGISPRRLPRDHQAPAALTLSARLRSADRSPLPHIARVELALAGRGSLDTEGLPTCSRALLLARTPAAARATCGDALVGHGRLGLSIQIAAQPPFAYHAQLLAFNGLAAGHRVLWLQVYGAHPPASFVLPVTLARGDHDFPTAMQIDVPARLGPWPHLASFDLTLARRFAYRGRRHSYLNASCPLPPLFSAGIFPFARVTYRWGRGEGLAVTIARGCRAAPELGG